MPYISKERVTEIREALKKEFKTGKHKGLNLKMSIVCENNSTVSIAVMEASKDLLPLSEKKYQQVNNYYIAEHYADQPLLRDILAKIQEIASKGTKTVSVDGDYGKIPNYYVSIQIGKWDKPFQVKK